MITSEFAERLIFGENPCLVWREYRTLTLKDMSNATGIENNKREPSIKQIKAIAKALKLEVDDLI
jgi:transcriptional regulator with XRE-family HTH domain